MRVLGVFAKWPRAGSVKTRLGLPADHAVRIANAFLFDTLDRLTPLESLHLVVFSPRESEDEITANLPPGWQAEPQSAGDLGQRLGSFFSRHLETGNAVVAVGTDSPTVPVAYLAEAFTLLETCDVVLGPACDGGYYLVGVRGILPPLFEGIDWSTNLVLEQTIRALSARHWRVRLLPPWYDVDTPSDWQLLRGHVAALRRAGVDPGIPRVEKLC